MQTDPDCRYPASIKASIAKLDADIEAFEESITKKRKTFLRRRQRIVAACLHTSTTYHPDPSGNNDSCYTCDVCGTERRRKF